MLFTSSIKATKNSGYYLKYNLVKSTLNDEEPDIPIPIPPQEEVEKIVTYIEKIRSDYSVLMNNAEEGIVLLKERRTALISAAVTGKIDVRDWQPPATQNKQQKQQETAL